ncbi:MAG: nicotinate (nicotinamide) nucleotide adenylyltransferase [Pseudobdellovibrionaceae bacterium]
MKQVALLGGSFNPPHPGHFDMAKYIYKTLSVDEVWFLFSTNWQKNPTLYAPVQERMAMGKLLAAHYPEMPFVMSNIQDEMGTHITYEVLTELQKRFPDHRFIWTMGADNLASFHTWEHAEDIIMNFPVAVVDRPPYTEKALTSPMAMTYDFLKAASPKSLAREGRGWYFLDNPRIDMSSSGLLTAIRQGITQFDGPFQDVARYILQHGLYGNGTPTGQIVANQKLSL